MLVGSYGTGEQRPLLQTGAAGALWTSGAGGSPALMSHVAFVGISFHAHTRDPRSPAYAGTQGAAGVSWLRGTTDLLIEDCVFDSYTNGITLQNFDGYGIGNVRIRRSQVLNSYSLSSVGHSQGLYASGVDGLLVEQSLFDRNGWNPAVPGAEATIYNHNLYIQSDSRNVQVRGNIIARGASHGIQLRPGGVLDGNLFVANSISVLLGGTLAEATNNVILEGKDIRPDLPRGWGIEVLEATVGVLRGNIVAHADTDNASRFAILDQSGDAEITDHVTYDWDVNTDAGTPGPFVDPERSVASYNAAQGGGATLEAFLDEARLQGRGRWSERYLARAVDDYIRDGFARPG
jgi:hypothetical protein